MSKNTKQSEFPFHIMVKPHGPVCNLACRYCFYLHKTDILETAHKWRMDEETLEIFVSQYIKSQPKGHPVTFAWQGGEPTLMGLDFFQKAVDLQNKYKKTGQKVTNSLQTNSILINNEWAEFLSTNDFLVGVSIDGPKHIHNQYRVYPNGEGSFDRVMESVEIMKKHDVEFNALTCVTNISPPHSLEIYRFLRDNFTFLQFIPIVEEKGFTEEAPFLEDSQKWDRSPKKKPGDLVHNWSVTPKGYGNFLCTVFDEWVANDVGKTFVQIFDVTLSRWAGQPPGLCIFSPVCGKAMAMEHDGTLYSCDHFVYPEYRLGNIKDTHIAELAGSEKQKKFGNDKKDRLPSKCKTCKYGALCTGACPKNRFITTKKGEKELNYLCQGYYRFFNYTEPYMKDMAALIRRNRPASDIMEKIKKEKFKNATPNQACPCGSGKKFKNCCGNK